jgi:hypothetical protein
MMIEEMRQLRASNERITQALNRMNAIEHILASENKMLRRAMESQQSYLENQDARERCLNAVLLGVPEGNDGMPW